MINLFLLPYGTDAVAAMGIALKVIMIAVLVFVGFAFGAQPLIGYNYGARNMPRLRGILRFSYLFLSLFALVMTCLLYTSGCIPHTPLQQCILPIGEVSPSRPSQ